MAIILAPGGTVTWEPAPPRTRMRDCDFRGRLVIAPGAAMRVVPGSGGASVIRDCDFAGVGFRPAWTVAPLRPNARRAWSPVWRAAAALVLVLAGCATMAGDEVARVWSRPRVLAALGAVAAMLASLAVAARSRVSARVLTVLAEALLVCGALFIAWLIWTGRVPLP